MPESRMHVCSYDGTADPGESIHRHKCETCGVDLCDCGHNGLCPESGVEATPQTVPGWVALPFVHVCVECVPEWADEQKEVRG